jgi:hypothetical protein
MIKKKAMTNKMAVIMPKIKKPQKFTVQTTAIVDGDQWYTVSCSKDVLLWIKNSWPESKLWHEHINQNWTIYLNQFDIHEKLYTMLAIRWAS